MRGEDSAAPRSARPYRGTPPRARGRQNRCRRGPGGSGNTPACAGKTAMLAAHDAAVREHPRVRGEDRTIESALCTWKGTPPRARGRHSFYSGGTNTAGNTPACAGKTELVTHHEAAFWEHPRVRGEDREHTMGELLKTGTPPRARGRLGCVAVRDKMLGNTPACAGKTSPLTALGAE